MFPQVQHKQISIASSAIQSLSLCVKTFLLSLAYQLSHPRENIILSEERIGDSPLLPTLSTPPGLEFSLVELSLRPYCLFLITASTKPYQLNVLIYSFNHTRGVYLPLTNYTGFHNCSFSEQPWVRLILTLRILQHALIEKYFAHNES
jgi:hypothetical protein